MQTSRSLLKKWHTGDTILVGFPVAFQWAQRLRQWSISVTKSYKWQLTHAIRMAQRVVIIGTHHYQLNPLVSSVPRMQSVMVRHPCLLHAMGPMSRCLCSNHSPKATDSIDTVPVGHMYHAYILLLVAIPFCRVQNACQFRP